MIQASLFHDADEDEDPHETSHSVWRVKAGGILAGLLLVSYIAWGSLPRATADPAVGRTAIQLNSFLKAVPFWRRSAEAPAQRSATASPKFQVALRRGNWQLNAVPRAFPSWEK